MEKRPALPIAPGFVRESNVRKWPGRLCAHSKSAPKGLAHASSRRVTSIRVPTKVPSSASGLGSWLNASMPVFKIGFPSASSMRADRSFSILARKAGADLPNQRRDDIRGWLAKADDLLAEPMELTRWEQIG